MSSVTATPNERRGLTFPLPPCSHAFHAQGVMQATLSSRCSSAGVMAILHLPPSSVDTRCTSWRGNLNRGRSGWQSDKMHRAVLHRRPRMVRTSLFETHKRQEHSHMLGVTTTGHAYVQHAYASASDAVSAHSRSEDRLLSLPIGRQPRLRYAWKPRASRSSGPWFRKTAPPPPGNPARAVLEAGRRRCEGQASTAVFTAHQS
jgi:hypothetical protein